MAGARAQQDRTRPATDADASPSVPGRCRGGEVESEEQEANG